MNGYRRLTFAQTWISAFLVLLLILCAYYVLAILVFGADKAQQSYRYRYHQGQEVIDETIKTAFTAQELLFALRDDLTDFDVAASNTFGVRHRWPDSTRTDPPPRHIRQWLESYPQSEMEQWLVRYSNVADARNGYYRQWHQLDRQVRHSVAQLPEDARPDRIMEARKLVRVTLMEAIQNVAKQRELLGEVLLEYQAWKKQSSIAQLR